MLGRAGVSLFQIAVLARLLAPEDFGLMALVAAVIAFAQIFADMGVSNAIIHHQKISQEALSSLYWLNVLAGVLLMLLLMLVSPLLVGLYYDPRMQVLLMVLSTSFLVVALDQQLRVIAEKNLRFRELARIELSAAFTGFVVAIGVAFAGGGVYALVAATLASAIMSTTLSWWMLADGWRPMWRLRMSEIREFLGFGAYMIGFNITNTVNLQADILIGGRVLGAGLLGTYSLSKELSLRLAFVINPIVTRVGLPVMAKAQGDKALLKSIYLKTLRMTASVNFPLYLAIVVFSPEIVAIMLGNQWQESAPLLRILALWGLVRSMGNPAGGLVFALGRARLAFLWSLGLMLFLVPAYWLGAKFGAEGLALSLLITMVALPVPMWLILIRPLCGAGFVEYFRQLAIPLVIAALAAVAGYGAALPFDGNMLRLSLGMTVGGLVYLSLSQWLNRTWFDAMRELLLWRVAKNDGVAK